MVRKVLQAHIAEKEEGERRDKKERGENEKEKKGEKTEGKRKGGYGILKRRGRIENPQKENLRKVSSE